MLFCISLVMLQWMCNIIQTVYQRRESEWRALNHGECAHDNESAVRGCFFKGLLNCGPWLRKYSIHTHTNTHTYIYIYKYIYIYLITYIYIYLIILIHAQVNLICNIIFQICCRHQKSVSNDQNDEISNPLEGLFVN